ncbi:MAG: hypothetical protein MUE49_12590, partial [Rhodospirillales bacterium]|nr:hypothetical protein [Rhodospirillales bacterium]
PWPSAGGGGEMIRKLGLRGMVSAAVLLSLAGCASIVSGTSEPVAVQTVPPIAVCTLERGGQILGQVHAPGAITVSKNNKPMTVHCNKEGYYETDQVCNVGMDGWVAGNIFAGGLIGFIVDVSTGAANDYEDTVTVVLVPKPTDPVALEAETGMHIAHYPHMTTK